MFPKSEFAISTAIALGTPGSSNLNPFPNFFSSLNRALLTSSLYVSWCVAKSACVCVAKSISRAIVFHSAVLTDISGIFEEECDFFIACRASNLIRFVPVMKYPFAMIASTQALWNGEVPPQLGESDECRKCGAFFSQMHNSILPAHWAHEYGPGNLFSNSTLPDRAIFLNSSYRTISGILLPSLVRTNGNMSPMFDDIAIMG